MKNHTKYPAIVTTILLSAALFAAPAHASTSPVPVQRESSATELFSTAPITAPDAPIKFERASVITTPADEVAPTEAQVSSTEITKPTPITPTKPLQPQPQPQPEPKAPVAPVSGKGAAIAAAAYSQLGVPQDCTALVSNSL